MPTLTVLWSLVSVGSVQSATPVDLLPFKAGGKLAMAEFSRPLLCTLSLFLSSQLPSPLRQYYLETRPFFDLLKFSGNALIHGCLDNVIC